MPGRKGRTEGIGKPAADQSNVGRTIAPLEPSRWQVITSGILMVLWIFFLAWMAFTG